MIMGIRKWIWVWFKKTDTDAVGDLYEAWIWINKATLIMVMRVGDTSLTCLYHLTNPTDKKLILADSS